MLAQVEADTGRPVVLRPEPGLQGKARGAYVASDPDPSRHLIVYDPGDTVNFDHLVAHELGHLTQHFSVGPSERRVAITSQVQREQARETLLRQVPFGALRRLPPEALAEAANLWSSGLITQLASFPADIVIERAIWADHRALRGAQRNALAAQATAAHEALGPTVAAITPTIVLEATNAMNYALLRPVSQFLREPWMVRPYRETEYEELGEELLELFQEVAPTDLASCLEVSDAWAGHLGLAGWYAFVPAAAATGSQRMWE
jgi:hypothetical protein